MSWSPSLSISPIALDTSSPSSRSRSPIGGILSVSGSESMSGSIFSGGSPPIGGSPPMGLSMGSMLIALIGDSGLSISGFTLFTSFINSSMLSSPCALRLMLIVGGGVSGFSGIPIGILIGIGESPQASVVGLSNSCILANSS